MFTKITITQYIFMNISIAKIFSNGQQEIRRIFFASLKKYGFQIKQTFWKSLYYIRKSVSPFQNDLQTLLQ
jgi:hypothetical protein